MPTTAPSTNTRLREKAEWYQVKQAEDTKIQAGDRIRPLSGGVQEPVAAVEAQATRRVVLENRKLVTKGEDLRLQGSTTSKTGAHKSEKGDEKRAHRGSHHDLMNDRNPAFSDRTEFSIITAVLRRHPSKAAVSPAK